MTNEEREALIDDFAKGFIANHQNIEWSEFDMADKDSLFEDAANIVIESQIGSPYLLQRRLKLGHNRAMRLIGQLENANIIGQEIISQTILFQDDHKLEIETRIKFLQLEREEEKYKKEKEKIKIEIIDNDRKRKIQKEVLKELIDAGIISNHFVSEVGKREPIPQDVMDKVWNRDGGKCVICGSNENIEFDHIIPFSKGGATTYRNMQILCKKCNIEKSNKIG